MDEREARGQKASEKKGRGVEVEIFRREINRNSGQVPVGLKEGDGIQAWGLIERHPLGLHL